MRDQQNSGDSQESLSRPSSKVDEGSMEELADFVLASLEEGYKSDCEPFEIYAQKLRSHIHTDSQLFRKQFLKGYESLLEELEGSPKNKP